MSRITVLGGTGYAGSAIAREAASRGHSVTALSRSAPDQAHTAVTYAQGDVTSESVLHSAVTGSDIVVGALAPRGPLAATLRDVYRTLARHADAEGVPLYVAGGFSSLRSGPGGPRFVEDLTHAPAEFHDELTTMSAVVAEDLPATPPSLDWVFVSPAGRFGSFAPGERLGRYRVGGEVALEPDGGGVISGADFALGFVDLMEQGDQHRAHLNLAY